MSVGNAVSMDVRCGDEACEFAMAGSECARSKTLVSDEMKGSDYSDPYGL